MSASTLFSPASDLQIARTNLARVGFKVLGGADGGYHTEADVIRTTADGQDLNGVWAELQAVLNEYNRKRDILVSFLTFQVTAETERVPQGTGVKFEEASEFGVPRAVKVAPNAFYLGYSWTDYDIAHRFTWKFLRDAKAEQIAHIHAETLAADNENVFMQVMKTIFNPTNLDIDIADRNYPVYKLYNNDGTTPPKYGNTTFDNTHSHYMVSGAAVVDSEDVEALTNNVTEHGYNKRNGTTLILLVHKDQGNVIRSFRTGVVNNNGKVAMFDFIPAQGQPAFLTPVLNTNQVTAGTQPPATYAGLNIIGSYGDVLIAEDDYIPTGYMLLVGSGGNMGLNNPVGIREHANPSYRGLRLLPGNYGGYPLQEAFYARGFGTGIRQRGGAAVMQIKASGSYVTPPVYANY